MFHRKSERELYDFYFDDEKNREIFERASRKCYFPANDILLDVIEKFRKEKKKVKVSFSISGVFFEQCERFSQDLLESFKQLNSTGCIEFLDQPYYHSLVGLYPARDEFVEQVNMHRRIMKDFFNVQPVAFENTELIYNNAIAKSVDELGYQGIFTEGVDRILKGRSPNFLYRAKGCSRLRVLLRNFKLTDDIGFRFSVRTWSEWPLTADKYASWLAETQGNCVTIFPDYETFGEHHWPETGIHEFLKHLPEEILKWEHVQMSTPSEVLAKHRPVGDIDVPELGGTISWADINRDTSGWLGNTMQWAYYSTTRELEALVKESGNKELLRLWRYFLISDHLYYMFTAGGAPGEVHTYFSPYDTPMDAFVTAQGALLDFESRLRLYAGAANEPFIFNYQLAEENATGIKVWSLNGMSEAMKNIDVKQLQFHNNNGDFEKWASLSLRDGELAEKFEQLRRSKANGESLRRELLSVVNNRSSKIRKIISEASRWF